MKYAQIILIAPPAPACFESRSQWVTYLESAQAAKGRPFIAGIYRPTFSFCADCSARKSLEMTNQGKCDWKGYQEQVKGWAKERSIAGLDQLTEEIE